MFPLFISLNEKKTVIVGNTEEAKYKSELLSSFGATVVIAEEFCEELLENTFLVVCALKDQNENCQIAELCRKRNVLVNVVDNKKYSDFYFPSVLHFKDLTVAVSTNGTSPSASKIIKEEIKRNIPEKIDSILEDLGKKREELIKREIHPEARKKINRIMAEICLNENRIITIEEFDCLVNSFVE